jgi:hypothetical protein
LTEPIIIAATAGDVQFSHRWNRVIDPSQFAGASTPQPPSRSVGSASERAPAI